MECKKVVDFSSFLVDKEVGRWADTLMMAAVFESLILVTQEINAIVSKFKTIAGESRDPKKVMEDAIRRVIEEEPAKAEALKRLLEVHSKNLQGVYEIVSDECRKETFTVQIMKDATDIVNEISKEHTYKEHIVDQCMNEVLEITKQELDNATTREYIPDKPKKGKKKSSEQEDLS